ncbi:Asp-tRNA(Asn)/Glu-tRNA(Gln) amidotransferase subunit GatC [Thiobacter aerophilum]|uniref:Aspartyl/glutamyl-tRNA(Asn/Gln) amidotransferase subunit C n=1 Tax=Thiobacter aerophilum TaxID=3121275 RepID=A0ABV0EF00_9BURK
MSFSAADVKRVAHLARIEITQAEIEPVLAQLSNILHLVEQMQAVDTEGITPMAHAQDIALRLREDEVTEPDQHELFQSIAPQVEAGLYLVPKVIE